MATLKKHGKQTIIKFMWYKKAYCEDGKVLKDVGFGWKVAGNVKEGYAWNDVALRKQASVDKFYQERPAFARLVYWLDEHVPSYAKRFYLKPALEMLYDDPDGLWSELNDHSPMDAPRLELSEVVELCNLYKASLEEARNFQGA